MKKIYFIGALLATAMTTGLQAQDVVTIDCSMYGQEGFVTVPAEPQPGDNNLRPIESLSYEGVTLTFNMGEGNDPQMQLPPVYEVPNFRLYSGNSLTISAPKGRYISEIQFELMQDYYQYGPLTADKGHMNNNGGDTDVKQEDKVPANPYSWTSTDMLGDASVTFSVDRTFDDLNKAQFRCTSVTVVMAPEFSPESLFTDYMPQNADMGEIDPKTTPWGLSLVEYEVALGLVINKDCTETIKLYHGDNVVAEVSAAAATSDGMELMPPYAIAEGEPAEDGEGVDPWMPSVLQIAFSAEPIVAAGEYTVVIPEGFLMIDGHELGEMSVAYVIAQGEGGDEPLVSYAGDVMDFLYMMEPESGLVFNEEMYPSGMQLIAMAFMAEEPITIDRTFNKPVILYRNGEKIREIYATTDPWDDATYEPEFTPVALDFTSIEDESQKWYTDVTLGFYESEYFEVGDYVVVIPDGFFQAGQEGEYKLAGATLTYRLIDGDNAGPLLDRVVTAEPPFDQDVNVADEWTDGMSYINLGVEVNNLSINTSCEDNIVLTHNGKELASISPTASWMDPTYVMIYQTNVFSDEADNEFGGNDGDDNFGQDADGQDSEFGGNDGDDNFGQDGEDQDPEFGGNDGDDNFGQDGEDQDPEFGGNDGDDNFGQDGPDDEFGGNEGDDNFGQDGEDQDPEFGGNDSDDPNFGQDGDDQDPEFGGNDSDDPNFGQDGEDQDPEFGGNDSDDPNFGQDGDDDEFGGNEGDDKPGENEDPDYNVPTFEAQKWWIMMTFCEIDDTVENPVIFNEPGEYVITIPDGFFMEGMLPIEGNTIQYTVVNNGTDAVDVFKADKNVTVFTIDGKVVLNQAPAEALKGLAKGIYVINGKKVVIRN